MEVHKLLTDLRAVVGACELYKELDKPTAVKLQEAKAMTYDKIKEILDNFYKEVINE